MFSLQGEEMCGMCIKMCSFPVSLGGSSERQILRQHVVQSVHLDEQLWKEGEGSKTGQREKSAWDAGLNKGFSWPPWDSGAKMASQPCYIGLMQLGLCISCFMGHSMWTTLEGLGTWVCACGCSAAEGIPKGLTVGGFLLTVLPPLGNKSFLESRSEELMSRHPHIL